MADISHLPHLLLIRSSFRDYSSEFAAVTILIAKHSCFPSVCDQDASRLLSKGWSTMSYRLMQKR